MVDFRKAFAEKLNEFVIPSTTPQEDKSSMIKELDDLGYLIHITHCTKRYYMNQPNKFIGNVPSTINFTIPESVIEAWQDDYADMRRFFIYGESLEFDELMQKMRELQERVRIM